MPGGDNGLFPPVDYAFGWIILALVIVVAIIAFYVLVPLLTRAREEAPEPVEAAWMPDFGPTVRQKYVDLIGEVQHSHERGDLGVRASHQKLSLLLRFFAYESSGLSAPQMTLADLRQTRVTPLSDAVERLYPGAFREIERGSVADAAGMARRVVERWN